jgi:hypothetical protein
VLAQRGDDGIRTGEQEQPMNDPQGSKWRRWDLHFHTPKSHDYGNKGMSAAQVVDRLIQAEIRVVAVTDHHRLYSVLHFTCLEEPYRGLVPRCDLDEILEPAGERALAALPKRLHCYIDAEKRLSLIRVHPRPSRLGLADLNRALGEFQKFVNAREFKPFAYLAAAASFSLTYLMHEEEEAREMRAWTDRRPLVSGLLATPVVLPLHVFTVAPAP